MIDLVAILTRCKLLIKNVALPRFHEDVNPRRDVGFIVNRDLEAITMLGFSFARAIPSRRSSLTRHDDQIAPPLSNVNRLRSTDKN